MPAPPTATSTSAASWSNEVAFSAGNSTNARRFPASAACVGRRDVGSGNGFGRGEPLVEWSHFKSKL
eukprot:2229807-Pyramimonas_sp.AAC.2